MENNDQMEFDDVTRKLVDAVKRVFPHDTVRATDTIVWLLTHRKQANALCRLQFLEREELRSLLPFTEEEDMLEYRLLIAYQLVRKDCKIEDEDEGDNPMKTGE